MRVYHTLSLMIIVHRKLYVYIPSIYIYMGAATKAPDDQFLTLLTLYS